MRTIFFLAFIVGWMPVFAQLELQLSHTTADANRKEGYPQEFLVSAENEEGELEYYWDFGDGSTGAAFNNPVINHIYMDEGRYTVTLRVVDVNGQETTRSIQISVDNEPPSISFAQGRENEGDEDNYRVFFESVTYDPGDDQLQFNWEFGDGNTAQVNGSQYVVHNYGEAGFYTVNLKVTDGDGGEDEYQFMVVVDQDWGARISGALRDSISGGSAMFYYYEPQSKECFKVITLYDDLTQSLLTFEEHNSKGILNREIPLTSNRPGQMNVNFEYQIVSGLYGSAKAMASIWDQTTDKSLLSETVDQFSFEQLARGMNEAEERESDGANSFSSTFRATGGKLVTNSLNGDKFTGTYSIVLEEDLPPRSDAQPRLIGIEGTFEINVNPLSMQQMENGCEGMPDQFSLVNYSPENESENVHPDHPCIKLQFNEDIDITSFNALNVQLGFNGDNGQFVPSPISFEPIDSRTVRIVPAAPLKMAVIYQVKIIGGANGVKSNEGGELESEFNWQFQTLVQPTQSEVRVYQSIADKPLVEGKDAMVRVVLDWIKPAGVDNSSFVKEFKAHTVLLNENGDQLVPNIGESIFKHQDFVSSEEIRQGTNSTNIFGWQPNSNDGSRISVELDFNYQQCVPDEERNKIRINHPIEHWDISPDLKVDYYFLKIHHWEQEIPGELISMGSDVMERACRFAEQIYPVKSIVARNGGILYYEDFQGAFMSLSDGNDPQLVFQNNNQKINTLCRSIQDQLSGMTDADMIVLFTPQIDKVSAGKSYTVFEPLISQDCVYQKNMRMIRMKLTQSLVPRAGLEHEMGHAFSLDHNPYVITNQDREDVAELPLSHWESEDLQSHKHIYGYRIYPYNQSGANKHCTEGNAESGNLLNVMFPHLGRVARNDVFINNFQYDRVMDHLKCANMMGVVSNGLPQLPGFSNFAHQFSIAMLQGQEQDLLKVSGAFGNNGRVEIRNITRVKSRVPVFDGDGKYTIRVMDSEGNTLEFASFDPDTSSTNCEPENWYEEYPFEIFLKAHEDIRSIKVLHDENVLVEKKISKNPPEITIDKTKSPPNIGSTLTWSASDQDNDKLFYSIYFSSNGINNWSLLSRQMNNKYIIAQNIDFTGTAPTIMIEASDGFHVGRDRVLLKSDQNFTVEGRITDKSAEGNWNIFVEFNSPVPWNGFNPTHHIHLIDLSTSRFVNTDLRVSPELNRVYLIPREKMVEGSEYMVMVSSKEFLRRPNIRIRDYTLGNNTLINVNGLELKEDFRWRFTYK